MSILFRFVGRFWIINHFNNLTLDFMAKMFAKNNNVHETLFVYFTAISAVNYFITSINYFNCLVYSPEFTNPSPGWNFTLRLPKKIPIGQLIYRVRAQDRDTDINGHFVFSISGIVPEGTTEPTDIQFPLTIEPNTGEVRVNGSLREIPSGSYRVKLLVKDKGTPALNSTNSFVIFLADVDEDGADFLGLGDLKMLFTKPNINLVMLFLILIVFLIMSIILIITIIILARKQKAQLRRKINNVDQNSNSNMLSQLNSANSHGWSSSADLSQRGSELISRDIPDSMFELGISSGINESELGFLTGGQKLCPWHMGNTYITSRDASVNISGSNANEESCFIPHTRMISLSFNN